jgi:hypothetical protein
MAVEIRFNNECQQKTVLQLKWAKRDETSDHHEFEICSAVWWRVSITVQLASKKLSISTTFYHSLNQRHVQ